MSRPGLGTAGASSLRADINVTPLVDVCLVLLIIFMVVAPLIIDGADIALPDSSGSASIPERGGQIVVAITVDGALWVNQERIDPAALKETLRRLDASAPGREVLVRGDRSLPYGAVREVFKRLTEAGVNRASLVTLRDPQLGGR